MQFSYQYTLDKPFYRECFEQCAPYSKAAKPKVFLLAMLILLGLFSIYGLENYYLGNFMIVLAILECVSYYFKASWWVQRHWWSRSGGAVVEVSIDPQGIATSHRGKSMKWAWNEFEAVHSTEKGVVLVSAQGNHYLSASVMPAGTMEFILQKAKK